MGSGLRVVIAECRYSCSLYDKVREARFSFFPGYCVRRGGLGRVDGGNEIPCFSPDQVLSVGIRHGFKNKGALPVCSTLAYISSIVRSKIYRYE